LPRYVEEELRSYLRCGVFAHGFVRAHCDACGHELLVAFSCKARGVCPSCTGRRMANVAAHLVDRALPRVPIRQWVLSLPFELRALAAFRADVLSALGRIFVEAIFARQRAWGKCAGLVGVKSGAVTHVQRFGSSINLNVHFHVMVIDGVFTRDERGPLFHSMPPPTGGELLQVVHQVREKAVAWLSRKGYLGARSLDGRSQETPAQASLEACAALAMRRGEVRALRDELSAEQTDATEVDAPPAEGGAIEHEAFNLHATVAIVADDDLGRERLMRYGARPPLALDRLRRLPGNLIAYRIKKLRNGRAKHRIMTPLEFLARLAAIVPPPRYPLLRYHGVLAPRCSWRREIVPQPRETQPRDRRTRTQRGASPCTKSPSADTNSRALTCPARKKTSTPTTPPAAVWVTDRRSSLQATTEASARSQVSIELLAPHVLSVKHWNRLLGGLLYAATPRVDWATLLRRSFEVDVLQCARCGGRLQVRGEVTDPGIVRLVLESLCMPTEAPRAARARDPTELLGTSEA
jgi:Putative transposase/Transposase zinc-binding domain